jgi:nucleoside-diphosphate-sugar epimerase
MSTIFLEVLFRVRPRQRPDTAYHVFIRALLQDEPITIFGDGGQSRSNTFIADCVQGITLSAFFIIPSSARIYSEP